jgi:hypothetical protein
MELLRESSQGDAEIGIFTLIAFLINVTHNYFLHTPRIYKTRQSSHDALVSIIYLPHTR